MRDSLWPVLIIDISTLGWTLRQEIPPGWLNKEWPNGGLGLSGPIFQLTCRSFLLFISPEPNKPSSTPKGGYKNQLKMCPACPENVFVDMCFPVDHCLGCHMVLHQNFLSGWTLQTMLWLLYGRCP